jgi:hypothetical protein
MGDKKNGKRKSEDKENVQPTNVTITEDDGEWQVKKRKICGKLPAPGSSGTLVYADDTRSRDTVSMNLSSTLKSQIKPWQSTCLTGGSPT